MGGEEELKRSEREIVARGDQNRGAEIEWEQGMVRKDNRKM